MGIYPQYLYCASDNIYDQFIPISSATDRHRGSVSLRSADIICPLQSSARGVSILELYEFTQAGVDINIVDTTNLRICFLGRIITHVPTPQHSRRFSFCIPRLCCVAQEAGKYTLENVRGNPTRQIIPAILT